MEFNIKNALQNDALFKFYSWMRLSAVALYIDLIIGVLIKMGFLNMEGLVINMELSQIICFILLGAILFPVLTGLVYYIHLVALVLSYFIWKIQDYFIDYNYKYEKPESYELSYEELKEFAVLKNNQVAYSLAIDCERSYALKRLNRYITTATLLLFCFDINAGVILSHIIVWTFWSRMLVYTLLGILMYFLLRKLATYNAGHWKTSSEALYNEVRNITRNNG